MNIKKIIRIDELIKKRSTGSPDVLASKIGVTRRTVFNYIKFMKEEMKAPIEYSNSSNSYYYNRTGEFHFTWKD